MKRIFYLVVAMFFFNVVNAQALLAPTDAGSKVHFVIKNFGIKTGGDLGGLKGTIKFDPKNINAASFDVTVQVATIDTDNETRDGHLKKEEYFDAEKYPLIHIVSTELQNTTKAGSYLFTGNLTIKGTTKQIKFPFTVTSKDGGQLFTGEFEINRRDFKVGGSSVSMADKLNVSLSVFAK